MITCDEFFAELGDYLENRLSSEVRQELDLHLAQCRACHVLYDFTCQTYEDCHGQQFFRSAPEGFRVHHRWGHGQAAS